MTAKPPDPSWIRALLRRGDPALGESLAPEEVARLRQRLADEVARHEAPLLGPRRLVWAALAAVLFAAVVLRLRTAAPPAHTEPISAAPAVLAADVKDRQIHFETPGGTRIVWVLSPKLSL